MHQITFYLDFISPYAYLAFEELPQALQGLGYQVHYKPLFLGGLLKHNAVLGPAEVPPKRAWIYRHVQWLAQRNGVVLDFPAAHPFNPLGLLRLAVASDVQGLPNRYVCETLFRHVWQGGADAADALRVLEELAMREVEPRDVQPGADEPFEHLGRFRSRPDGRDDLRFMSGKGHGNSQMEKQNRTAPRDEAGPTRPSTSLVRTRLDMAARWHTGGLG